MAGETTLKLVRQPSESDVKREIDIRYNMIVVVKFWWPVDFLFAISNI